MNGKADRVEDLKETPGWFWNLPGTPQTTATALVSAVDSCDFGPLRETELTALGAGVADIRATWYILISLR